VATAFPPGTGPGPLVLVAFDGGIAARNALRWAGTYAATIGAHLCVITVAEPEPHVGPARADPLGVARSLAEEAIRAEVRGDVPREVVVARGDAALAIAGAAERADILVLGNRATRGRLGSVAAHCLHDTRCPIVLVP
jgi:nucleotide-binding universal stress UspA family protein